MSGGLYWNLNFSISPSNEYSGLISFKINWFDILAVQETFIYFFFFLFFIFYIVVDFVIH